MAEWSTLVRRDFFLRLRAAGGGSRTGAPYTLAARRDERTLRGTAAPGASSYSSSSVPGKIACVAAEARGGDLGGSGSQLRSEPVQFTER